MTDHHRRPANRARWVGALALCACGGASGGKDATPAADRACSPLGDGNVVTDDGMTAEGLRVVVVRSSTAPAHFRIFFGTSDHMSERQFVDMQAAGFAQFFRFDADGATVTAIFASPGSSPQFTTRYIDATGASHPMTTAPGDAGAPGAGLTFFCF